MECCEVFQCSFKKLIEMGGIVHYCKHFLRRPHGSIIYFEKQYSYDSKSSKNIVGHIVKKLNKENKSLFGKLIETRKERKKSISKSSKELPTKERKISDKTKLIGKANCRSEVQVIKAGDVTESKYENKVLPECGDHKVVNVGLSDDDLNTTTHVRSPRVSSLPPIVLKNIKGFPLINKNKNICSSFIEASETQVTHTREYSRVYPSVSKILNATMSDVSKLLLKKWRQKMITELGEDGFMKFYKAQLYAGVQFHEAIQSFLRGTSEDKLVLDGRGVAGCWKSLSSVIPDISDIQVLEGPVCHSHLFYHGVMDCIASYQGEEVLIEWKKSDKPKPTLEKTYDAPIQLTAYIGAMNYDQKYPLQVKGGLVVIAYSDGSPADTFHMSLPECNKFWLQWLERVQSYWLLQNESHTESSERHNNQQ